MNHLNDIEAFEKICGNCCGLDIKKITTDDVKRQCEIYQVDGEWIEAAIRGLKYHQQTEV